MPLLNFPANSSTCVSPHFSMVIYVFSATEVPSPQLPADAPPDSQVAASVEAAVHMAAADDEVRLMHGPFVCKPLLFDGKCLVFKGIGRRSAGPGRRVIVIFMTDA